MPIVEMPDGTEIEFPDNMSDQEIKSILMKKSPVLQPQPMAYDPTAESMAMFSPIQAAQGAKMFAPEIGATAGGVLGSKIPIPGAGPFMSGLGYAGGEAIKSGQVPSLDQFTQDFGKGTAMDLAVKPFSWIASKAFKPIKQGFEMLRAGQLAERGLPIPASAINPTDEGLALAKRARETYPGNQIVQEAHNKLRTGATEMLEEFQGKYITGVKKADVDQAFTKWAKSMGGEESPVDLPNAIKFIEESISQPFAEGNSFWQKKAMTFLQNPTVQGLRNLWQSIKGGKDFDKGARQKLLKILDDDLLRYGEEVTEIRAAARSASKTAAKERPLADIIEKSHATIDGVDTFLPDKFARLWNNAKKTSRINTKYSVDEIADIDSFAEMMGVIGSELSQRPSSKGAGSLLGQAAAGPMIGGGLTMAGLPGGKIIAGAGLALPGLRYLTSRRAGQMFQPGSGLYQSMRGGPLAREMIPGVINVGGKLILLKGSQLMEEE
jgi:hypothetical protein